MALRGDCLDGKIESRHIDDVSLARERNETVITQGAEQDRSDRLLFYLQEKFESNDRQLSVRILEHCRPWV